MAFCETRFWVPLCTCLVFADTVPEVAGAVILLLPAETLVALETTVFGEETGGELTSA